MAEPTITELSQKVDRILLLLEGTPHQPGVLEWKENTDRLLNGDVRSIGIVQKVNFMWRAHIWIVGGLGTLVGFGAEYVFNHIK